MPSINDLSESKYVGKDDVANGMLVTIAGYERKDVSKQDEPEDMKYTLSFNECKPLVLNLTNGNMIGHIMHTVHGVTRDYQADPDEPGGNPTPANTQFCNWIGKQVVLYNDMNIQFQGKVVGGIRVRPPQQQAPPPSQFTPDNNLRTDDTGPLPTPPSGDVPF